MADDTLKMSGGSLGGTYTLAQFHFHWGEESRSGSEHYMNGSPAPMEVDRFYFAVMALNPYEFFVFK